MQLLEFVWKFGVVSIVILPWWSMLVSIAVFDWLLDWVFLGIFYWCGYCAGFFIWIINIALLPFTVWGMLQRLYLEVFSLMIDGWMLFFGGSGCFLRYGHHCWFTSRFKDKDVRGYMDIPWMISRIDSDEN